MARGYNIKWSDKDERELQRLVKNFNAKVRRLEEKEPYLKDERPDRISTKDIKKDIVTRQDFNRILNKFKRFSRRGAEDIKVTDAGTVTTEWQFKEASIMQRAVTTKRRKKREGVESWQRKESESLFDKPKPSEISPKNFEKYVKSLEKEIASGFDIQRKEHYLRNYIQTTKNNLGVYATPIINYVESIPIDDFIRASFTNPFLSIEFLYPDGNEQEIAEQVLAEWQRVT